MSDDQRRAWMVQLNGGRPIAFGSGSPLPPDLMPSPAALRAIIDGSPATPPAAAPDAPAAAQAGNAGWQGSVQQGAAVAAHTNLRTGAAQPADATTQVQAGATYQAHPDGGRGAELGLTAQYGQTTDGTGQRSDSAGVGAQVAYVAPVGPVVTEGQRVTLSAQAGVGVGVQSQGGVVSPQVQASVGVQVAVPLSKSAALNFSLTDTLTNPHSRDGTNDVQAGVGLQITIPGS